MEWGVLTMAEVPQETAHEWDVTAVAGTTPTTAERVSTPLATESQSTGVILRANGRYYLSGALGSIILVGLLS